MNLNPRPTNLLFTVRCAIDLGGGRWQTTDIPFTDVAKARAYAHKLHDNRRHRTREVTLWLGEHTRVPL
jgi:hypothetical protein